jgi:hypothetical protein
MSILQPSESVMLGAATAGLVFGVYQFSVPNMADVHASEPNNGAVIAGRKKAVWTSAAILSGVTLLTRDRTVFTMGGVMLAALDFHVRHANAVHPATNHMVDMSGYQPVVTG